MNIAEQPVVLFIPGFMQRGEAWRPVAEIVGERYRSICLDPQSATLAGRVEEIAAGGRDGVLVGYSLGGRLALTAALAAPQAFRALITVGAGAGITDPAERARRLAADQAFADWIETQPIETIVERWERQPIFATQSSDLVDRQRAARLSHDPAELATLLRSAGQGAMEPVWDRLGDFQIPVLALAGELDTAYLAHAARLAAAVPDGRSVSIAAAGHAPQLERPAETASSILEFLDARFG